MDHEKTAEDGDIVALYLARDEAALAMTQRKYGRYCHSIAENILGNAADAEECVNDALKKAWDTIPPHKPKTLSTYLGMLVRQISLNRARDLRAKKRGGGQLPLVLEELEECIADPDAAGASDDIVREALDIFLGGLPQRTRMVFMRRYWFADSISTIAATFGMREGSVHTLLSRTRKQLKDFLAQQHIDV